MLNTASPDKSNKDDSQHNQAVVESAIQRLKGSEPEEIKPGSEGMDVEVENEIVRKFHKRDYIFPECNGHENTPINRISEYKLDSITSDDYYKGLYVRYDPTSSKFVFKDKGNNFIGSFMVDHLVRYFGSPFDIEKKFMRHLDDSTYNNAKQVIKNFVGYPEVNKQTKSVNITPNKPPSEQ